MSAITEKALSSRINRRLTHDERMLKKSRGERDRSELGEYYVVDMQMNLIDKHVDLSALGRELGLLRKHESVAGEEAAVGGEA